MAFLSDTFTDPDGTLITAHTPEVGGVWTKLVGSGRDPNKNGSAEIQTGRFNSESSLHRNEAEPSSPNYSIAVDLGAPSSTNVNSQWTYFHVGARITPVGTAFGDVDGYFAGWEGESGWRAWVIAKRVGGVVTQIEKNSDDSLQNYFGTVISLRFEVEDDELRLYLNDVLKVSTTDSDIVDPGRIALALGANGSGAQPMSYFDNLSVEGIGAPVVSTFPWLGISPARPWLGVGDDVHLGP